jgi:hypothetical protein
VSTVRLGKKQKGYFYSPKPKGNTMKLARNLLDKYIVPLKVGDDAFYSYRYLENNVMKN